MMSEIMLCSSLKLHKHSNIFANWLIYCSIHYIRRTCDIFFNLLYCRIHQKCPVDYPVGVLVWQQIIIFVLIIYFWSPDLLSECQYFLCQALVWSLNIERAPGMCPWPLSTGTTVPAISCWNHPICCCCLHKSLCRKSDCSVWLCL